MIYYNLNSNANTFKAGLTLSAASITLFDKPAAQNGSKQRLEFGQARLHWVSTPLETGDL